MDSEEVAGRLAAAVKERRSRLGMSQERVAKAAEQAGISISAQTVREIEQGRRASVSEKTERALEAALQWPTGTVRDILAGEPVEAPPPATSSDELAELRAQVDQLRQLVVGGTGDDIPVTVTDVLRMFRPDQLEDFAKVFTRALEELKREAN